MPRPQGGRGGLPHLGPSFATPGNHTPPGRTGTKTPSPWRKAGQCLEGAQEPTSCALSLTRLMGHTQQSQETNCLSNALIKIQHKEGSLLRYGENLQHQPRGKCNRAVPLAQGHSQSQVQGAG